MIIALVAALAIPWAAPVSFGPPPPGWHVGRSGTVATTVAGTPEHRSTAWAGNVAYRDRATADPPNATLRHLRPGGIVVWVSIQPPSGWPPDRRRTSTHLSLADAYRFACCEGADVPGGEWELYGWGPRRSYSVLVRVYFGSRPSRAMRGHAQDAIDRLILPAAHS
jgi:hypothetical protein